MARKMEKYVKMVYDKFNSKRKLIKQKKRMRKT